MDTVWMHQDTIEKPTLPIAISGFGIPKKSFLNCEHGHIYTMLPCCWKSLIGTWQVFFFSFFFLFFLSFSFLSFRSQKEARIIRNITWELWQFNFISSQKFCQADFTVWCATIDMYYKCPAIFQMFKWWTVLYTFILYMVMLSSL